MVSIYLIFNTYDVSRQASLGHPGSRQPSLGPMPWSILRPSVFTGDRLARPGLSTLTGSPLTAQPSPPQVKAPPPLPPLPNPRSPIDWGSDQQGGDRICASSV